MATPFHVASPCTATAYPRSRSSSPSRSRNASSASLVSCKQTTSGRRSSSQGSSRGTRCLTELTFQVATRTDPKVPAPPTAAPCPTRRPLRSTRGAAWIVCEFGCVQCDEALRVFAVLRAAQHRDDRAALVQHELADRVVERLGAQAAPPRR